MITKQEALKRAQNEEDKLFIAHLYDLAEVCDRCGQPRFTGFADLRLTAICEPMLKQAQTFDVCAFGGYKDAERKMIGLIPYGFDDTEFPIAAVVVRPQETGVLSHRDYMGAVLSLGITRAQIGDIVLTEDGAVVLATQKMADYIVENLTSVGSVCVKCETAMPDSLSLCRRTETIEGTVATPRADAVVALFCNMSRTKVSDLFSKGLVTVNYQTFSDPAKKLSEGDIIVVRGYGKACLSEFGNTSRKGRLFITLKKYV